MCPPVPGLVTAAKASVSTQDGRLQAYLDHTVQDTVSLTNTFPMRILHNKYNGAKYDYMSISTISVQNRLYCNISYLARTDCC